MGAKSGGGDMAIRDIDLNQCGDWDWRSQGAEDAKNGIPAEKALAKYTSDCEQHADGPNTEAYMMGYDSVK